jgi:hypothetical protein
VAERATRPAGRTAAARPTPASFYDETDAAKRKRKGGTTSSPCCEASDEEHGDGRRSTSTASGGARLGLCYARREGWDSRLPFIGRRRKGRGCGEVAAMNAPVLGWSSYG